MNLTFNFSENEFLEICIKKLQRQNTTVFEDLYESIIQLINTSTVDSKYNIIEIKHSYKTEYYDKHLSLKERGISIYYPKIIIYTDLENELNISDITLPNFLKLSSITYGQGVEKTIKIKKHNLKTKNKITIELLLLTISSDTYGNIIKNMEQIKNDILLPSKLGVWEWRQTFYNKFTGEIFLCECFKKAIDKITHDNIQNTHKHLRKAIKDLNYKPNICHICNNTNSDLTYCHEMYGSSFQVRYGAYIEKLSIEKGIATREAENQLREQKGIAKIGERWINETLLFNYIKVIFPKYNIIREASPEWIGQQRLDIYIHDINLAIEYQGEQHFKPVSIFGGQEGLLKTKERDKLKLQKCKRNKVELIYFTYKDNLSEKLIMKKLKKYLNIKIS